MEYHMHWLNESFASNNGHKPIWTTKLLAVCCSSVDGSIFIKLLIFGSANDPIKPDFSKTHAINYMPPYATHIFHSLAFVVIKYWKIKMSLLTWYSISFPNYYYLFDLILFVFLFSSSFRIYRKKKKRTTTK